MHWFEKHSEPITDFRKQSILGVAASALFLLSPFAINNWLQGRYLLGVGSLAVVLILAANCWAVYRNRYYPNIVFLSITPIVIFFLDMALRKQGIIGLLWCYPAVLSFYFMFTQRAAWLANVLFMVVAVPEIWHVFEQSVAIRATVTLSLMGIFAAIFLHMITRLYRQLQEQAVTDPLTGLSNRLLFETTLEQAVEQYRRIGTDAVLITIDLDHFKSINDTLGHAAGDEVLRKVGKLLSDRVRRSDAVFRIGGEEFAVLLRGAGLEDGRRFAEELLITLERQSILPDRTVTMSAGVAALQSGETWREWMKSSDKSLYSAKESGRNRVAVSV